MKIIVMGNGASALMLAQALLKLNHEPAILTSEDVAQKDDIQQALQALDEMAEVEERRSQKIICGLGHAIAIRKFHTDIIDDWKIIKEDFFQNFREKPYYHGELRKKRQNSAFGKSFPKKPQKRFSRRYNHLKQRKT